MFCSTLVKRQTRASPVEFPFSHYLIHSPILSCMTWWGSNCQWGSPILNCLTPIRAVMPETQQAAESPREKEMFMHWPLQLVFFGLLDTGLHSLPIPQNTLCTWPERSFEGVQRGKRAVLGGVPLGWHSDQRCCISILTRDWNQVGYRCRNPG